MSNGPALPRDALDDKANRFFAGKVVRKDLVRKVKVGANVPVCVANQAAPDGSLNATQSGWKNSSESTDP